MNSKLPSSTQNRHFAVDLAKCFAAVLVVGIHTSLGKDIGEEIYFGLNLVFCRLGVPFFAATTGYFLYNYFRSNGLKRLFKQEKKLIKIYAIWSILYLLYILPNWIAIDYLSISNLIGFGKSTVLFGSYFHLWYLVDVIYMLPVYYIIAKYFSPKICLILGLLLWGIYAIHYGYCDLMPNEIKDTLSFLNIDLFYISGPFVILPMMLIGGYIKAKENLFLTLSRKLNLSLFVLCLILLYAEAIYLRQTFHLEGYTRITMVLPITFFALVCALQCHINGNTKYFRLSQISLLIYCVHPMIELPLNNCNAISSETSFVLTLIGSTCFAFAIEAIRYKIDLHAKK